MKRREGGEGSSGREAPWAEAWRQRFVGKPLSAEVDAEKWQEGPRLERDRWRWGGD